MAQELVSHGDRCFVEEDYEGAVQHYSEALHLDANNAKILEARALAHIKLKDFVSATCDATRAIELDPSYAKAYLRKGIACFEQEEYESALDAFEAGDKIAPDNIFKTWIRKCQAELEEEGVSPPSKPPPEPASAATSAAPSPSTAASVASAPVPAPAPTSIPISAPLAPSAAPVFEGKYRHQHYQLQNKVTVDVYAKGLKKEQVKAEFQEQHMTITILDRQQQDEDYKLDVELYGKIRPSDCKVEVLSTKVEVIMIKADTIAWPSLEKSDKVAAANYSQPGTAAPRQYPSSKGTKDWDKVENELKELENKGELDFGDPLNNFFKKIFSQGDEDQRRAMMKSFTESNGTVLSTNWNEVGKKKVECTPPDGMEVKKWKQ